MTDKDNKNLTPAESCEVVDVDWALKEWQAYQELTEKLLNPSDYQYIGRKRFKKKSAWRKYMKAFRISTRVIEKDIIKDDSGRVIESSFLVRAWMPDGREAEGWGNCSKFERGFSKPNHDIPATAMTRAINRAVSDLIGAGEVSAEEMEGERRYNRNVRPVTDSIVQDDGSEVLEPSAEFDIMEAGERNANIKQIIIRFQMDGTPPTKQNILKRAGEMLDDPEEPFDSEDFRKLKKDLGIKLE